MADTVTKDEEHLGDIEKVFIILYVEVKYLCSIYGQNKKEVFLIRRWNTNIYKT